MARLRSASAARITPLCLSASSIAWRKSIGSAVTDCAEISRIPSSGNASPARKMATRAARDFTMVFSMVPFYSSSPQPAECGQIGARILLEPFFRKPRALGLTLTQSPQGVHWRAVSIGQGKGCAVFGRGLGAVSQLQQNLSQQVMGAKDRGLLLGVLGVNVVAHQARGPFQVAIGSQQHLGGVVSVSRLDSRRLHRALHRLLKTVPAFATAQIVGKIQIGGGGVMVKPDGLGEFTLGLIMVAGGGCRHGAYPGGIAGMRGGNLGRQGQCLVVASPYDGRGGGVVLGQVACNVHIAAVEPVREGKGGHGFARQG